MEYAVGRGDVKRVSAMSRHDVAGAADTGRTRGRAVLVVSRHVTPSNAEPPHVIFAELVLLESVYWSVCIHVDLGVDIIVAYAV